MRLNKFRLVLFLFFIFFTSIIMKLSESKIYFDSIKVNLLRCICDEPFYQILFIVGITFYFSLIYPIASCQSFFKLHLCHKFYIVLYTKMISMFKNSKNSFFSVTPLFFHFILLSSIY